MADAFGPHRSSVQLSDDATELAFKLTDFQDVSVLAIATHGLMANEGSGIYEAGLVFTPPATASSANDGFLTATEVSALRIDADWVILSACNTAAGDGLEDANGLSGLARSFFFAGAKSLIASHWPVDDLVASRLTVRTIEIDRDELKLSRAEAFSQSMREIRESSEFDVVDDRGLSRSWAHPFFWAPFEFIGDGAN